MMMKKEEVLKIVEQHENDYTVFGIRLDTFERTVGKKVYGKSKYNERSDVSEHPKYGTKAYKRLPKMDGILTYDMDVLDEKWLQCETENVYLIGGNTLGEYDDVTGYGETVIADGVVIAKLN